MRVAIGVGGVAHERLRSFEDLIQFAVEAEKLGVDVAWSAEAWGYDAVSPLAYLAARTERMQLGTGVMQISARVPAMTAMTALTLDALTRGRFLLGLGASGPQVVEGLHGTAFQGPLTRLRETIDIVRQALRGERIAYRGRYHELPRPGGEGKSLRLAFEPRPALPVYLASITPRGLELTGELADGWLGTSFLPERADAHVAFLEQGARRAGRRLADLDLQVGGPVQLGEDVEAMVEARRPGLAFSLGAMGSARTNFYNEAYRRAGFEDACIDVQRLWLDGRRDEAAARVPEELVLGTSLLGTEAMVRERIRAYRDAGVTTLRVEAQAASATERLDTLGRVVAWVRDETAGSAGRRAPP